MCRGPDSKTPSLFWISLGSGPKASPPARYVPDMREEEMDGGVHQKAVEISQLPSTAAVAGDYGNVRYLAQQLLGVI